MPWFYEKMIWPPLLRPLRSTFFQRAKLLQKKGRSLTEASNRWVSAKSRSAPQGALAGSDPVTAGEKRSLFPLPLAPYGIWSLFWPARNFLLWCGNFWISPITFSLDPNPGCQSKIGRGIRMRSDQLARQKQISQTMESSSKWSPISGTTREEKAKITKLK